mgnify:FL=1
MYVYRSNEGSCEGEIRRRIAIAKSAMSKLDKIWKDRGVSNSTKIKLVRSLVHAIFLYAAETWTIKAAERRKIDAFEMWCWRRMLRIPWTARRTNESIRRELCLDGLTLANMCTRRILQFFGHVVRGNEDSLERLVVIGNLEGKRGRGRSPTRWTDQVKTAAGTSVVGALRAAQSRESWRRLVASTRVTTLSNEE